MQAFVLERQGFVYNRCLGILLGIRKVWGHFCVFLHACAFLVPYITPIGDITVRYLMSASVRQQRTEAT